jgi:hypothetical protein
MHPTPGFIVKHSFLELEAEASRPARPKLRRVYSDGVLQIINRLQSHSRYPTGDVFNRQSMPKVVGPEEMPKWWMGQRYGKREMQSDASTRAASLASSVSDEDLVSHHTTLRISNLPAEYSRQLFAQTLDKEGFAGFYDFLFVPLNLRSNLCDGVALVNFRSSATAAEAYKLFESFSTWLVDSQQVSIPSWSEYDQGLDALIERYRNSPLMHRTVPETFKPAIFNAFGEISQFPDATRAVRKPRKRGLIAKDRSKKHDDCNDACLGESSN